GRAPARRRPRAGGGHVRRAQGAGRAARGAALGLAQPRGARLLRDARVPAHDAGDDGGALAAAPAIGVNHRFRATEPRRAPMEPRVGAAIGANSLARGTSVIRLRALRTREATERATGVPVGIAILRPVVRTLVPSEDALAAGCDTRGRPRAAARAGSQQKRK